MQRDEARTIFERSVEGRRASVAPTYDVSETPISELIPEKLLREKPAELPEVSEPEIVRHYNRISRRNFDLDTGPYPLGSCTMKHNPRLNEKVAALPGHARLHPAQDAKRAQGALELMWNLERSLSELTGLPHVSLQPSAGSHGELAGLLLTRAYHADRGQERTKVLTPDTAHGTNPATVTMAGYEVVKVATAPDGGVDVDDLRAKADESVACLMLTNPNTLGIFDRNIREIAEIVHGVGGTLYYDGANLNAVMGWSRPGDMGFDIVHLNLHKSFSQPHGGGGPGAGPIAVSDRIAPFLPVPRIVRSESENGAGPTFDLEHAAEKSIGRMRGFQGNFGVFVRSYAYTGPAVDGRRPGSARDRTAQPGGRWRGHQQGGGGDQACVRRRRGTAALDDCAEATSGLFGSVGCAPAGVPFAHPRGLTSSRPTAAPALAGIAERSEALDRARGRARQGRRLARTEYRRNSHVVAGFSEGAP